MSVKLLLTCSGCYDATAEVGPLRRRYESLFGGPLCAVVTDDPEDLTPEGWVMFDPWTFCTYCPDCWAQLQSDITADDADNVTPPRIQLSEEENHD